MSVSAKISSSASLSCENWPVSSAEGKTTCYPKKGIPTNIFNKELNRSYEDRIKCFELLEKGEKILARKLISSTIKRLEQFINYPDQDLLDLIFIEGLEKRFYKNQNPLVLGCDLYNFPKKKSLFLTLNQTFI